MLARHRLEFGHVERRQDVAQRLHARRLRRAVRAGRCLDRVAGVEQHGAALLHVGVDLVDGILRRLRRARHDRPVDQREEGELVARRIDADGIAGLQRGALGQEQRQPVHPRLDDGVDVGIARHDIGEAGLRHRLHRELVRGTVGACRRGRQRRQASEHKGEQDHCGRGAAAQQRGKAAAEHRDDDGVDQEQRKRSGQQPAAQVARLSIGVGGVPGAQARGIQGSDAVGASKRVHGERSFGRTIEAGRMIGGGAVAVIRRQRFCGCRRRAEGAEAVEDVQRRDRLGSRFAGNTGARLGRVAGHVDYPPQHFDEGARHRQVRPAHVGADVEQADEALAAMLAGHERRAVFQRGPALGGEHGVGLGQHLAAHGDVLGHRDAGKRAVGREGSQMLRLFPGQTAAERAAALAQLDRDEIVLGLRQPWPCEPHQHAALVDPGIEALAELRGDGADIGEDDHRQLLVQKLCDALLRRALVGEPDVGERRQRAGEIEGRRQQRLRGLAGRARDDADRAAAPALVEQLHRAGRALAGYFEPGDVVAQLDRQVERRFGFLVLRAERIAGLADRRSLLVERAYGADRDAAVGAQHLHRHLRRSVLGRDQRQRRGSAAFEHGQAAIADGLAEALHEVLAAAGVDAVGEPGDLAVAGDFEETVDRSQRLDAIDRIGLRRELPQRDARRTRRHQGDVAVRL